MAKTYAQTFLGKLNIAQMILTSGVFIIMNQSYQLLGYHVYRLDALVLTWISGGTLIMSLLLLASSLGEKSTPRRLPYRYTYAIFTNIYLFATICFITKETLVGDSLSARFAAGLTTINCFVLTASAVTAFQPVIV